MPLLFPQKICYQIPFFSKVSLNCPPFLKGEYKVISSAHYTNFIITTFTQPSDRSTVSTKDVCQTKRYSFYAKCRRKRLLVKIVNICEKNQLKILLNKQEISDFRFDLVSKGLEAGLLVSQGENTLMI